VVFETNPDGSMSRAQINKAFAQVFSLLGECALKQHGLVAAWPK